MAWHRCNKTRRAFKTHCGPGQRRSPHHAACDTQHSMAARQVALVTGGGSGIGRASALEFARQGCAVVVADIDEAGGAATCEQIAAGGGEVLFVRCDVAAEAEVVALLDAVRAKFGRLHFAHNNAGVEGVRAATHEYPTEEYDRVFAINARGVWLCLKHEVPLMLQTGNEGAIVCTSSTAGLAGMPDFGPYSASKHAILGMARSAAREYAGRIRVNCIAPATTDTAMVARFTQQWPEWQAATNASYPMGRIATAAEVGEAAVWLCLRSTFTTGSTLTIDGGLTC